MRKVLLLNPPGKRLYIRDYFCSKVSQADYIHPPIDLVILSGILAQSFEVAVLDAMAGRLAPAEALAQVCQMRPDFIISLIGAVSFDEDTAFLTSLKQALPHIKLVGIGDVFCGDAARLLEEIAPLDAVLLDFTDEAIVDYLQNGVVSGKNLVAKTALAQDVSAEAKPERRFSIPIPRHELFTRFQYRHPFVRRARFVATITDYGCPFQCSFCIMKTLGYKVREPANVLAELQYVCKLGIREVLFCSQTFGAHKGVAEELCRAIIAKRLDFGWVCFSRVDVVSPAMLSLMKQAGCHTIIFGVESGADEILKASGKGYTHQQILQAVEWCRAMGIETVGTFILGLPEESEATMKQTLDLLRCIPLDYASFNVAVPRAGTDLRAQAIASGLADSGSLVMDQSGTTVAMPTKFLSRDAVARFRRQAVRVFYLRPTYIVRRLSAIRSFYDARRLFRQACRLLQNTYFG